MEGKLMGYKIPKLTDKLCPVSDGEPLPDWRLKLRNSFLKFSLPAAFTVEISTDLILIASR